MATLSFVMREPFTVAQLFPITRTSLPLDEATREEKIPAAVNAVKVSRLATSGTDVAFKEAAHDILRQAHDSLINLHNAAELVSELRRIACCWW
jgi:hypothetical protein